MSPKMVKDEDFASDVDVSDDENDPQRLQRLGDAVIKLHKRPPIKHPSVTEPSSRIAEFNLASAGDENAEVNLGELTEVFKRGSKSNETVSRLKKTKRSKTLPAPLAKPVADRIRRSAGYDKVKNDLERWEPIVTANREASILRFPLPREQPEVPSFTFRLKSDLEKDLEEIWGTTEDKSNEEEISKVKLTYDEMMERRQATAKLRAVQSYAEAKARRQSKIKSKTYHRIQKKAGIKKQIHEFEQLVKTNPDEAHEMLEKFEKVRAQERASLRHRNTGKWAQNLQVRAKYDKETRQALAEQLTISRELTHKHKNDDSEEEESVNEEEEDEINPVEDATPWTTTENEVSAFLSDYRKFWETKNTPKGDTSNDNVSKHKKQSQLVNKVHFENPVVSVETISSRGTETINESNEMSDSEDESAIKNRTDDNKSMKSHCQNSEETEILQQIDVNKTGNEKVLQKQNQPISNNNKKINNATNSKKRKNTDTKKTTPSKRIRAGTSTWNVDSLSEEETGDESNEEEEKDEFVNTKKSSSNNLDTQINALKSLIRTTKQSMKSSTASDQPKTIDPGNFLKPKTTKLPFTAPEGLLEIMDEDDANRNAGIAEVFEDDDLEADFRKKQQEELDKNVVAPVDTFLPGWGSWAGPGIKHAKKKRNRFLVKFPTDGKHKKKPLGSGILSSKSEDAVKPFLMKELPFPFKSVDDFHASLKHPISKDFVPAPAFDKLNKPPVITKMGRKIEPMSEDVLLQHKKKPSYSKV